MSLREMIEQILQEGCNDMLAIMSDRAGARTVKSVDGPVLGSFQRDVLVIWLRSGSADLRIDACAIVRSLRDRGPTLPRIGLAPGVGF